MADERPDETVEVPMTVEEAPVEPARLIVLAVPVVIPALGAAYLVAHLQHRCINRDQQNDNAVLHLPATQPIDTRIAGRPLDLTVPRQVIVRPVPVLFAIRLVVLVIV